MRRTHLLMGSLALALALAGSLAVAWRIQAQSAHATPLILEKDEGERRVWQPVEGLEGEPGLFVLKVDPRNGRSSHLVVVTEDLEPQGRIHTHRHPGSDEVIFLENGTARVTVGDQTRDVHGGATVFAPAGSWISIVNTGKETIHGFFVFSAPGFEEFMRAESVREGEKVVPLSKAQDAKICGQYAHAVVYK
jgi:quercetin dioxygenase-like cupin family protein